MSFEQDIRSLFRQRDRDEMLWVFDLWSLDDVRKNAESILARLEDGSMPCDGSWPDEKITKVRDWIAAGLPN